MSAVKYFIEQNMRKLRVDEFLSKELNAAGYGGVEIRKMPMRTEVVIQASRPGVVIGRRGAKIRDLTYALENEYGIQNVQVEVVEIENPWLSAPVMASKLARQLEHGVRYRRMAYWILRRVMRAGAYGCEIIVKGKLGSRRARYQKFREATIAKTGQPADLFVDKACDFAVLKPGTIGVQVKIMRPDAKIPGVIHVKKAKPKKAGVVEVSREAEGVEEVPEAVTAEAAAEEVGESLEGITDIEELRELEELDALDLVEETGPKKARQKTERESPSAPESRTAQGEEGSKEAGPSDELDETDEEM
ncbi:MAG: 30S ribosomal protein S3 [Candidatus Thorarchaeota archaeon]|nr:MAG: 30S ribosomal protein S3 [Candidatus Thorarchaeota archaeon]